jgi:site-specific recombinase XerD
MTADAGAGGPALELAGDLVSADRNPALLVDIEDHARAFARASKAPSTLRAYRSGLADFQTWCEARKAPWLPATPATVALYVSDLADAGRRVATIQQRMVAISQAHQLAGQLPSPTSHPQVRATLAGIRRTVGTAQRRKAPLVTGELRRLARAPGPTPLAEARDRALLLLGFAAALRRSELAALDAGDVPETGEGLIVQLRRSQTDQAAASELRGVPYGAHPESCPVRALRAWLAVSGISEGPLFRPITRHGQLLPDRLVGRAVARIVQRACARAGLDAAQYGGHSLRAGLATAAAAGDAPEWSIMRQGGWRSSDVARGYIRPATLFKQNAAAYTGL